MSRYVETKKERYLRKKREYQWAKVRTIFAVLSGAAGIAAFLMLVYNIFIGK